MSTIVASLIATITGDSSGLKKSLAGAKTDLKSTAKEMENTSAATVKGAAKMAILGAAAGMAAGAVAAVGNFMKSSVNDTMAYAKEVRDVARYTGTTAEESSKLLQVADDLQIKTQTLLVGFRSLSKQGIQPTTENLKEMAAEYKTLSAVEKAQYAMENFGARSGMELAKVLEMTGEEIDDVAKKSEVYGLVLDDKAIGATEDYRLAVDDLGDAWQGLKTTVGMEVVPVLADATEGLAKEVYASKLLKKALEDGIISQREYNLALFDQDKALKLVEDRTRTVAITTDDFAGRVGAANNALEGMVGGVGAAITENGGLIASLGGLAAEFDPLAASQKLFNEGLVMEAKDLVDVQQAQLNAVAATGEMTDAQVAYAEIQMESLRNQRDLNAARKKGLVTEGEYLKIIKDGKVTQEEMNTVVDSSIPIWAQAGDSIATAEKSVLGLTTAFGDLLSVYDPVTTAQGLLNNLLAVGAKDEVDYSQNKLDAAAASGKLSEAQLAEGLAIQENLRNLRDLTKAYEDHRISEGEMLKIAGDGIVTNEELAKSVGLTAGNMTELQKATGITAEQWDEYGEKSLGAADLANSGLVDTLTTLGVIGGKVGEAQTAISGVTGAIDGVTSAAGIASSAIDGIGASINALPTYTALTIDVIYNVKGQPVGVGAPGEFGERGGNVFKAAGGPVAMGNAYIVGEQGPEWFVPNTSGRIVPNASGGGGGIGGDTYNIYNNSTGAAALTMAIIAQSHRARLSRSMGG